MLATDKQGQREELKWDNFMIGAVCQEEISSTFDWGDRQS